jgi:Mce-associated membrane protein
MSTDVHADQPTTEAGTASVPPTPPRRKPGTAGPRSTTTARTTRAARAQVPAEPLDADEAATAAARPRRPVPGDERGTQRATRLPWALAIAGLVGTLVFGGLWLSARGGHPATAKESAQTTAVRASAEDFSKALTNFDGATIDRDFDRLLGLSTGDFQDQADQFFSSATRKALKQAQASSRGEIRSAYVQSVRGDRASVFVVVDQTIANNKSPQPQADTVRMELTLQRGADGWQVSRVNVLQPPGAGTAVAPGGTSGSGN